MKTILITGGCGFIGSHLCKKLIQYNKIICVDNLYTGFIKNIEELFLNENFKYINHNIIHPLSIDCKIDEIYHLACPASPPKYQIDPIYTLQTIFIGTLNILELAKKHNSKILYASTSEIYGEPKISPQNENYRGNVNTIGIRSCYDEGKRVGETLMMEYFNKYKIKIRIARIFNTYGPNMNINDGRVITNFINQIILNKDITVYGNGTQTRSFCYIDDQIDGLIKLMDSNYIYPINIGYPNEIQIIDLIYLLFDIFNKNFNKVKSRIVYEILPSDDPTHRKPDITLAKKILNWEPKVDLTEGLIKTIKYFL
jgi:UDP-glucuronate decarboxylase